MSSGARDWSQDNSSLLSRARRSDLHVTTTPELHAISRDLALACDAARLAAIGKMLRLKASGGVRSEEDTNCSFATLFAAFRRVRAELSSRNTGVCQKPKAPDDKQMPIRRQPEVSAHR